MVIWSHVALAGVWGGLLALERRAFLQAMFSRPLVAATTMGLLLDDLRTGLFVGMLLELFHLGAASLGAALPENETASASCSAAAAAALANASGGGGTPFIWSVAILLFVGMGRVGRVVDRSLERYSSRLASKAVVSAETGDLTRAVRQNLWGMWPHFVTFGAFSAVAAAVGYAAWPLVEELPRRVVVGLAWAYPAMASVAAAVAAKGSHARNAGVWAGAAAAVVVGAVAALTFAGRSG